MSTGGRADFRITLSGVGSLQDIPLGDVADLLSRVASLFARGAAEELNRPITGTGRWESAVDEAASVRLVSLHNGSLVADIAAPPSDVVPLLGDAETLTERAFDRLFTTAHGQAAEHPTVAAGLADLLDRFAGFPEASITVSDLRPGKRRAATVPVSDRHHLRSAARAATMTSVERDVAGRVFEANLERRTAHVRTPANEDVTVTFDEEHEHDIRRALGDQAELRGDITFDPKTNRARSIRVRQIVTGEQLSFAGVDFWAPKSLDELAAEQGTRPIEDPAELALEGVSDAEWDAFFEAIGLAN